MMIRIFTFLAIFFAIPVAYAQQTQTFPQYLQSLPFGTNPTGVELYFMLQNGAGTKITGGNMVQGSLATTGLYFPTGAAGNGTTDDRSTVQNALNRCQAGGGGTVVLGPFRYLIDTVGLSIPAPCILECPSPHNLSPGAFPIGGTGTGLGVAPQKYEIILNSSFSISMAKGSGLRGCAILQKASAALATPTTPRTAIAMADSFAGTGVTIGPDVFIENVFIGGFDLGITTATGLTASRARFRNVDIDATACIRLDSSHDISDWFNIHCFPYLAVSGGTSSSTVAISNIADNGSDAYRVTTSTPNTFVSGDTVWIDRNIVGAPSAMGRWKVSVIDPSNFDLRLSDANGVRPDGNVTSGQTMITGLTSLIGIGIGSLISGTGIPAATAVSAILTTSNSIILNKAATASNNTVALTITDGAYTSGGTATIDGGWRSGIGFEFTNTDSFTCTGCFVYDHLTSFHVGNAAYWIRCIGCASDMNPVFTGDRTQIGVLIDGASKASAWVGYTSVTGRNPFVINSTTSADVPHMIIGSNLDSTGPSGGVMVELDSGSVVLNGNAAQSTLRFISIQTAAGILTMTGNSIQNRFSAQSTSAMSKVFSSGNYNAHVAAAPAPTACGTLPAITTGSTDYSGEVTEGTASPTGCVLTFATPFYVAPQCTVTTQGGLTTLAYAVSTTAMTITHDAADSKLINWSCTSREGR